MTQTTRFEPGMPSWVDLSSPDPEAAKRFYGELFGWAAQTSTQPGSGGYTMFLLGGAHVAGLGPLTGEGQPPAWSMYVTVADVDATVRAAESAGAKALLEPVDVLDVGRMAILSDPAGAVVSLWQPRAHQGADRVDEPGTMCWHELVTRDPQTAKAFYGQVFGWQARTHTDGGTAYTEWRLGDRTIGGMMEMGPDVPAGLPPHWLVYFAVADCSAAAGTVVALGGTVLVPPTDVPPGRFAVARDPQGATFALLASRG